MNTNTEWIDRIKAARIDHDESQRDIAKFLNIPQSQYQKYEAKINAMPVRYLIEICSHYAISADYILGLPRGLEWPR